MNEIQKYIAAHEPKMMDDLFSLIRIPSISALPEHHDDMLACAERWAQLLLEAGVDEALVMPSQGNPVVFAQKIVNPDAKTVLIYAHYDVMPAEPLELWKSEPFEPEIRDGYIWARGADDDKGQSFIQVKAFEYLVKNGLLKNNVKFIFEGEEEIGSPSLEAFCEEHKELLKADVILVSDTSMLGAELPSLTTGLRGLAYWEIEVTGPNRDLHSGHFGGAVANPINALCQIISKVTDADGRITVPGFYDDVEEVPQTEREMIAYIPFDEKKYKEAIGVKELFGEKGYSTLERNSCRPSFDVCGIWGGYTGEGSKTVLPSKAYAKVSCRLVPHQDHHKISQMFADYILSITPDTVQVKVTPMHGGQGYVCPISLPAYQAAEKGFEIAFGKKPLAVRRGGSIPIISTFEQVLGIKTVLMGFGLESNAIHSPNENCSLDIFRKGIEAVIGDGWLVVVLRDAGHGEAVDFAARAVGQIDDNNGDSLCRREREGIQLFRRLAWIGKDNGRAFARIDGAAAADAEYGLGIGGSAEGRRLVYGAGCGVGSHLVVQGDAYAVLGAGCGDVIPCAGKLVGMPAGHAKDGVDASGLQIGGDVINLGDGSDSKIGRCLCADFLNITLIESSIPHGGLLYGKQIRLSNQTNCSFIHN